MFDGTRPKMPFLGAESAFSGVFAVARNLAEFYRTAVSIHAPTGGIRRPARTRPPTKPEAWPVKVLLMSSLSQRAKAVAAAKQALDYYHKSNDTESARRVEDLLKVINR